MKKIAILFLALFLMATVADASTWLAKPAKIIFNECPAQLTIVRYGLNYITSGVNRDKACVYVTVRAKGSVLFGCAYFKVYTTSGVEVFKAKRRIKLFEGSEQNYYAYIPVSDASGGAIKAEIGVGCDCNKPGY
jgi:hypothetical protein